MTSKTAIIIGGGAKARDVDVEFCERHDVEVWGFNAIRKKWVRRWDRMFNIHRYDLLRQYGWPVDIDAEWAADHPHVPFYTADKWPDGRMVRAELFPRDRIAESLPNARNDYHCNTFDWLIAFACYLEFAEVHLHGCNLTTDGLMEQMSARACVEYWSGFAEGRGTKIVKAPTCNLFLATHMVLSTRLYGYDDSPAYEDRTKDGVPYRFDE